MAIVTGWVKAVKRQVRFAVLVVPFGNIMAEVMQCTSVVLPHATVTSAGRLASERKYI